MGTELYQIPLVLGTLFFDHRDLGNTPLRRDPMRPPFMHPQPEGCSLAVIR
jgi:hypothetical protein